MNKTQEKQLWIELDLYERNYVTVYNLDCISYTTKYIEGFIGERPSENFSHELYNKLCVIYIKKLFVVFDRVKKNDFLLTPTSFSRKDIIKHVILTLEYTSHLKKFISQNYLFKKSMHERIDSLLIEIKKENVEYQKIMNRYDMKCLKGRI
jgi:hypothetical protein